MIRSKPITTTYVKTIFSPEEVELKSTLNSWQHLLTSTSPLILFFVVVVLSGNGWVNSLCKCVEIMV